VVIGLWELENSKENRGICCVGWESKCSSVTEMWRALSWDEWSNVWVLGPPVVNDLW
jgi:hypothetical protein